MSPAGYSEAELVEQPALEILAELGWTIFNADREFERSRSSLGRETAHDAILIARLRPALERLNAQLPSAAIEQALDELTRDRSRMSLTAANKEIHDLLKNGVRVAIAAADGAGESSEVVQVIDWQTASNNDFLVCAQLTIKSDMYTRRPDAVGFVNGLPLVVFEFKAIHQRLENAVKDNIRDYKQHIPQLFWTNGVIIVSNGVQSRVGSLTAGWEHFAEWKKISSEAEPAQSGLQSVLRGVCEPSRLLDILENFTIFQEAGSLIKLTPKNHQYLGVNNAIAALQNKAQRDNKLGVFWHTQGSGKSISMLFFCQKAVRTLPGNWTFVIITDRQELDAQIYKHFASAGLVTESRAHAASSRQLRQLLSEDHRYVFSLIHKFRTETGAAHPVLSERDDIIVITDEAHRSQYNTLALNMRTALPNASFLAFTGTPLIIGEEKTRDVFGDYISIYNFQQSVLDGATVPLYYENRIPELQLINDQLNADMEQLLAEAELNEAQEHKLEREFAREYHLITRDERLETIAKDIVEHFSVRGLQGKAMVICIDKATAVRMYNKVQTHWAATSARLEQKLAHQSNSSVLVDQITWMRETDMAVVVSQGQNEISDLAAKGLDILPHRRRMVEQDLETKFKNADDPLRLVFVCAMWITGFDVPSCATLYLDKPMRNHTLMQTIARANRVYPGKINGLIVDYAGVFRNLEQALAIYGASQTGNSPVEDKSVLVAALRQALNATRSLLQTHGVDLHAIHNAPASARTNLIADAVEALIGPQTLRRQFFDLVNSVSRFYKAILPDTQAQVFAAEVIPLQVIAQTMRNKLSADSDISHLTNQVTALLDRSIASEGYIIRETQAPYAEQLLDLSRIDFAALAQQFTRGRKRTLNQQLQGSVDQRLQQLVRLNRTRMDYLHTFQTLIENYNSGGLSEEALFHQIIAFIQSLNQEEQRTISEQLSEEELAVFDLLTRPSLKLSPTERNQVKHTARDLLATLKAEKLVLDWRKRERTRAEVRVTIEKLLDQGLPTVYTSDIFEQKTAAIFEHIYDAYQGAGRSIYGV